MYTRIKKYILGGRICVGCSTKFVIVELLIVVDSFSSGYPPVNITESHHSTLGTSSLRASVFGAMSANLVAELIPVFLAI